METPTQILTLDSEAFAAFYQAFQRETPTRYRAIQAFSGFEQPQDFANHIILKQSFLDEVQAFLDGKVTENEFYNRNLSKPQLDAVNNVMMEDTELTNDFFDFVRDGQLFERQTMVMCYVRSCNPAISSRLDKLSSVDYEYILQLESDFARGLQQDSAFITQKSLQVAYDQHKLQFLKGAWHQDRRELYQKLKLKDELRFLDVNYAIYKLLNPNSNEVLPSYPYFDLPIGSALDAALELKPYDQEDQMRHCGLFKIGQTVPQVPKFRKPSAPYFLAAYNDDVNALKKALAQNLYAKEAGLSALHYAIIGNAPKCVSELLDEKYSKTAAFWLQMTPQIGAFVPDGANCLWLCYLFGRTNFVGYFKDLEQVECMGYYPTDLQVALHSDLDCKMDASTAIRLFKHAMAYQNVGALRYVLQTGLIRPPQLKKRCLELLEGEEIDEFGDEVLAYMRIYADEELLGAEAFQKLQALERLNLNVTSFSNVFGVMIGRAARKAQNSLVQRTELNAFFDSCISGAVSQADLDKYGEEYDMRDPGHAVVHGFTGYHYVAYYGHSRAYSVRDVQSAKNTVVRYHDFDVLLPEGISALDCYRGCSRPVNPTLLDLGDCPTMSTNLHFYALTQKSADALVNCYLRNYVPDSGLQHLLELQDSTSFDVIYQHNHENARKYRMLANAARIDDIEANYAYTTQIDEPESCGYKIGPHLVIEPNVYALNQDADFFERCKSQKLAQNDISRAEDVDLRSSDLEKRIYYGMSGLFYAILAGNVDNIKLLLPRCCKYRTTEPLVVYRADRQAIYVPAGAAALHFAVLAASSCVELITAYYQRQVVDWMLSYAAVCIATESQYNKSLFQQELAFPHLYQQVFYQLAVRNDVSTVHELLETTDRASNIAALLTSFKNGYLPSSDKGRAYDLMRSYIIQQTFAADFNAKFAPFFGCQSREELLRLYDAYAQGDSEVSFDINSPIQNQYFTQCMEDGQFTQDAFACKGARDSRPTGGDVINGATGLLYCLLHNQDQKALQLFKYEGSMAVQRNIELQNICVEAGTSPLKLCLLIGKLDLFEKICKQNYDDTRAELAMDKRFIEFLLQKDWFSQVAVQFYIETSSEDDIVELIKQNSQTRIGQHLIARLSTNEAFQLIVIKAQEFSQTQKEAAKSALFKINKQTFQMEFGEEELRQFQAAWQAKDARSVEQSGASQVQKPPESRQSNFNTPAADEWFEACKTAQVKGNEYLIGSIDRRTTDLEKQVYYGFSGLFYAILAKNNQNVQVLSARESSLKLAANVQLQLEDQTVELQKGVFPVQFALIFHLEKFFAEPLEIPPNSEMFYLYGKRAPPGVISQAGLKYCIANKLDQIVASARQQAGLGNSQQAVQLIGAGIPQSDAETLLQQFYNDKLVASAFAAKFGASSLAQRDLNYQKSIGAGVTTSNSATLFKAVMDRDLTETRRLFQSEQATKIYVDVIISDRFVPRGSTIFHVLPFSSLDIVLWVIQREECAPALERNRLDDNFLDVAMQVNSNASLLLIDRFGRRYCEAAYARALHRTLRHESRQMLDQLMKYAAKHENTPFEALYNEEFRVESAFSAVVLDAMKCQALCQLFSKQRIALSDELLEGLNSGHLSFGANGFQAGQKSETKESDVENQQTKKQQPVFAGFRQVMPLMQEKWRRVGKLVMGADAQELVPESSVPDFT